MNRASFTLCLLLGTLGASLIAIGVARDLERSAVQPKLADSSGAAPTAIVTIDRLRIAYGTLKKSLGTISLALRQVELPTIATNEQSPPSDSCGVIELIVITNGPSAQRLPTAAVPEPKTTAIRKVRGGERRRLSKRPAATASQIRVSQEMVDAYHLGKAVSGRVLIGPGRDAVVSTLDVGALSTTQPSLPTVSLCIDGRASLYAFDGNASYGSRSSSQLPWQPLRLWQGDADAMAAGLIATVDQAFDGGRVALDRLSLIVRVVGWADRRIELGYTVIVDRLGLDFLRPSLPTVQNAARRLNDGRK